MYGLKINEPYATLIARGIKTVETRRYRPPSYLYGRLIALIARAHEGTSIVGVARLEESVLYANAKAFRRDYENHCVPAGSVYDYNIPSNSDERKYGWVFTDAVAFREHVPAPKTGGRIWVKDVNLQQILNEVAVKTSGFISCQ